MKYNGFKIFKFSTISKMNNRISDGFSRIDKNIKKVPFDLSWDQKLDKNQ